MGADVNVKIVEGVYDAFSRGDVAAILEAVTDDVDWATEGSSTVVPWYGPRKGKAGVTAFFEAFGSTMNVEDFTPISFAANDTDVLTVVRFKAKSQKNGRQVAQHLHHFFKFRDGRIAYYRGSEDTSQTEAVFR
ncbi:MAG: nuclear transport factor 2 family protein [Acidimicrobiia bacterium]